MWNGQGKNGLKFQISFTVKESALSKVILGVSKRREPCWKGRTAMQRSWGRNMLALFGELHQRRLGQSGENVCWNLGLSWC